jgi:hypothetical protein
MPKATNQKRLYERPADLNGAVQQTIIGGAGDPIANPPFLQVGYGPTYGRIDGQHPEFAAWFGHTDPVQASFAILRDGRVRAGSFAEGQANLQLNPGRIELRTGAYETGQDQIVLDSAVEAIYGSGEDSLAIDNDGTPLLYEEPSITIGEVVTDKPNILITAGQLRLRSYLTDKIRLDTAGDMFLTGTLEVGAAGVFKSGATGYDSGVGWWMEYNAGLPRLFIGNSAGNKLTWDGGTLAVYGTLYAYAGQIGGWTINPVCLVKDTGDPATSCGMAPNDWPFYAGQVYASRAYAPFRVTPAGAVTATNLTATGGSIGGWSLVSNCIYSTNIWLFSGAATVARLEVGTGTTHGGVVSAGASDDVVFWAGNEYLNRAIAPFRATAGGEVWATNAHIAGEVDANSGYLGSLTVDGTLMVGAGGAIASGASAFLIGNGYWLAYNVGAPQFRVGIVSGGALIRGIAWDGADLDIKASYLNLHGNLEIDTGYALQMGGYDYLERSAGVTIITGQTGTTPEKIRLDIAGTQAVGTIWALGLDTLEWTPKDATGAAASDVAYLKLTGATANPILNMYSPTASSMFTLQLGYDATHRGTLLADYGEFAEKVISGQLNAVGDIGGVADSIGFTKTSDLTTNDTGVGTIKFKGATSRDSVGFIKIYIGTTAYYIPCFNAITG